MAEHKGIYVFQGEKFVPLCDYEDLVMLMQILVNARLDAALSEDKCLEFKKAAAHRDILLGAMESVQSNIVECRLEITPEMVEIYQSLKSHTDTVRQEMISDSTYVGAASKSYYYKQSMTKLQGPYASIEQLLADNGNRMTVGAYILQHDENGIHDPPYEDWERVHDICEAQKEAQD